ncbi:hypothetical protein Tco_0298557 [Tanacetum coccineum]
MAVVEVPQTLKYKGGQLNAASILEVENFTNWKKRFMGHIIGIEPQFENIISNGPYIPMAADDQMNSIINCLTTKSTWDDLILYHEGPSNVKENRVMDLKLCYNTFKFKEGESLTQTFTRYKALMNELVNDGVNLSKLEINTGFINGLPKKWLSFCQSLRNTNHVKDSELASLFGKLKYEENLINSIYETEKSKSLVSATPLSTAFFSASIVQDFQDNLDDEEDARSSHEYLKDLEEEYRARALLAKKGHFTRDYWSKTSIPSYQSPFQPSFSTHMSTNLNRGKNKGLIAETYDWDEEEVSSDENKVTEKALMALSNEEIIYVSKESASNGEWVKISIQKVHTLLEMEDNDDRKSFLDYLCIDLNYVEEQRNNLMSKHRNLVQELNTCKEQLLVLKRAKLDLLTMKHVNTEILKENQNLRNELKELTSITEAWLNSSNKFNHSGPKDPVFVKSLAYNSKVSITSSNKPKLSETEDSTLSNYNAAPLPLLEKLIGVEPISGPKTIKSILKSKSTFKAKTLKGITINEASLAARGNKSPSVSKTNSAPVSKLKNVKIEDDPPQAIVMKELNELKLQISKNKSSYFRNKNFQQCKRTNQRTCDHDDFMSFIDINQYHIGQSESSSRSRPSRPAMPFPSYIHYGYNDHQSNDCVYYPICEICGSYEHDDTHGHNRIIFLRREIKPRNPQHIIKNCETCGSNVHTTSDHNDIEWFRKTEALQAKKAESFKASKTESSSALRSKTPTKRYEISMIGVLTYFLKFQIKQPERGISINKEKDVNDLLRMYDKIDSSVNTLIMPHNMLGPDLKCKDVNESQYRGMIGPLINLIVPKCKSTSDACQLLEGKLVC